MKPRKTPGKLKTSDLAMLLHELFEIPFGRKSNGWPGAGMKIVDAISTAMKDALKRGEDVSIPGFGIFRWRTTPIRKMPSVTIWTDGNFKTAIRASKVLGGKRIVVFEPSIQLMAMLNKDTANYKEARAKSIWNK